MTLPSSYLRLRAGVLAAVGLASLLSISLLGCGGGTTTATSIAPSPKTLSSISIAPANPSVALGSTAQFSATGTYSDGSKQDLTASVTWKTAQPAVAIINNSGTVDHKGDRLDRGDCDIGLDYFFADAHCFVSHSGFGCCWPPRSLDQARLLGAADSDRNIQRRYSSGLDGFGRLEFIAPDGGLGEPQRRSDGNGGRNDHHHRLLGLAKRKRRAQRRLSNRHLSYAHFANHPTRRKPTAERARDF